MIDPQDFLNALKLAGIDFACGVPDSLLKEFLVTLQTSDQIEHHITANEGAAIALAAGHQMASGKLPLVYMQNSGLGNAVSPLMSLAHRRVYAIPMLLLIGHRGEAGKHDEPQHLAMGEVTIPLLADMGVDIFSLNQNSDIGNIVQEAAAMAREQSGPVAIVVSSGTFLALASGAKLRSQSDLSLTRELVLNTVLDYLDGSEIICSTTGFTSRELNELRLERGTAAADFFNVGAMGHVGQIALGVALAKPDKRVIAIDGDGSLIMHMGSMASSGSSGASNFLHLLINNGMHESVGGQPTVGLEIDFCAIARACNFKHVQAADDLNSFTKALTTGLKTASAGPTFIEVKIKPGAKEKLGRPSDDLRAAKKAFSAHIAR